MTTRMEVASRILAGFASNPAIFAQNGMNGWSLVNCTDDDLVGYACHLADRLEAADAHLCRAEADRLREGGR